MSDRDRFSAQQMPVLEEMLQSLLLIEEGEHEFGESGDIREFFFPVTRHCTYLNHAANGPLPRPVARGLHEYIEDRSAYASMHGERWRMYEQGAHRRLADMIGARAEQIAFTASTGDGMMMIAYGLPWQEGESVITAEGEFPGNVYPWLNLSERGVRVHLVAQQEGRIPVEAIFERIEQDRGRTRLVSLSLVEFSTGYCNERGILCGIDAMQALGALAIDVQALDVDYLAAAAHKWLLAPQTTGI